MKNRGPNPRFENRAQTPILLVDDDPDCLSELHDYLNSSGFDVRCAESAACAIKEILSDDSISVVVTDVKMPSVSGIEMIRRLAGNDVSLALPRFIIVTGHATLDDARAALHMRVDDFLPKPIDLHQLVTSLERSCGLARQIKETESRTPELLKEVRDLWTAAASGGAE